MAQNVLEIDVGSQLTPGGAIPFKLNVLLSTWLLGKTRTGKSTVMLDAIAGTIRAGLGCAVIDPHGPLIDATLRHIPASRLKDVVLIDLNNHKLPGITYFPRMTSPEVTKQNFNRMMEVKAGPKGWGPQTQEWMFGALDSVCDAYKRPTILEIHKFLNRESFRQRLMKASTNPLVKEFYAKWYSKDMDARKRMEAVSHPANKVVDLMRPGVREILCQKRSLDFARLKDEHKIVLVRVPKYEIGKLASQAIGNAALMNIIVSAPHSKNWGSPWPVFIDEVHNFLDGIDLEDALAELAKTGVTFFFATQTTAQMKPKDASLPDNAKIAAGNCSSIIAFRISGEDSEIIALNSAVEHEAPILVKLENYNFFAWTLHGTLPVLEGPITTYPSPARYDDEVPYDKALAWARENVGTEKAIIRADIEKRLKIVMPAPQSQTQQRLARQKPMQ